MLERDFQKKLIKEIKTRFPDAVVLKNDARYLQGIPDLSVFCGPKWAMLECKNRKSASKQPNQERWVEKMDAMSFSRLIFPENKEEVLHDLSEFFQS